MFSPTVVLCAKENGERERKKKRVKILCFACQRRANLPNHERTKSRMHLLSLGHRNSRRPSRLFLYISIRFDMCWRVWTSKSCAALRAVPNRRVTSGLRIVCLLWVLRGWGVKTGKHDDGYTSGGLWGLQWPLCVLTLLPLPYKSYPERFIGPHSSSLSSWIRWAGLQQWRRGDKFAFWWVQCASALARCHNEWLLLFTLWLRWKKIVC